MGEKRARKRARKKQKYDKKARKNKNWARKQGE